ncbi:ataxin-10 [Olea europaea subsp. europaea]|uniref:Ataxin-10 n=1 Tax=Olea europaea subsp. europaea TaxID=158383 RepID=A0A8S0SPS9_OLEEU|nr:ataxin-10 [Olea europaea subsp. europaea]
MDGGKLLELGVPHDVVEPLLVASDSSTLEKALVRLIEISRTPDGRSDLASKNALVPTLTLCQSLCSPPSRHFLLLSLKLLRNLCAGEIDNQNLFIEQTGVGIVSSIFNAVVLASGSDYEIIRLSLQLLGNVSLAGEEHQLAVWQHFFPLEFLEIAKVRSKETCDPLCMVIYTCCEGNNERMIELFTDQGLQLVVEIIRTATLDGFKEDWLKLLLSTICLDKSYFAPIFSKLFLVSSAENFDSDISTGNHFGGEHAFLLSVLSEILNERIMDVTVSNDFALSVLGIFRKVVGVVDFVETPKSGLPTALAEVDVLGYSLTILRDVCACGGVKGSNEDVSGDLVDVLVSSGLIELLLSLLRDLEPPLIIRKTMRQSENQEATMSSLSKRCPYKGFRRDVVAIIGNCSYRRKHVQSKIREQDGILLLLQQCVSDEDNPFLREWGIWSVRNILEGNRENQQVVANLELQGSVDVPEIAQLGLRVEVDPETRRAKLVNV